MDLMEAENASPQLDPEFLIDFGGRLLDAWNRHDPDAVAALCTEDVSWNDAALPEPAQGRDGVAEFVRATVRAFPDLQVEVLEEDVLPFVSTIQPRAFAPYQMSGTMLGDWPSLGAAATHRRFSVEGVDRWTFRDGLICHYTTYYDSMAVGRQLGLMPEPSSFSYRAMMRGQHLQAAFGRRKAARTRGLSGRRWAR
jgi:steroid delta-isomerase-like uncharacterized protein